MKNLYSLTRNNIKYYKYGGEEYKILKFSKQQIFFIWSYLPYPLIKPTIQSFGSDL